MTEEKNERTQTTYRNRYAWKSAVCSRSCSQYTDTKGGVFTFEKALYRYPTIIAARADQGYRGTFKNTFEIFHNIRIDISPRIQNTFEVQPLRWKVERTFSWFQGSRRLSKDYEIKAVHAETMCIISHIHTLLRRS